MGENNAFVHDPFEGWELYPTNLDIYDPIIINEESYDSYLHELSSILFCDLPNSTSVDILDVYDERNQGRTSLQLEAQTLY